MKSKQLHSRFIYPAKTARLAAIVGLLLFGLTANGHARIVTLRWIDPNPDPSPVTGFRLHVGTESRNYDTIYDVGLPTPDAEGIRSASADVPDTITVEIYVAMSAYTSDGSESTLSNENSLSMYNAISSEWVEKPI